MTTFLQFLIIGLGSGATYALFAQGAVLIYRGSGLVNFAQGALGTLAAYVTFVQLKEESSFKTLPAALIGILVAALVALAFQQIVLRALRTAAPIVRVIATVGLLGLLQALITQRYGTGNVPVEQFRCPTTSGCGAGCPRPGGAGLPGGDLPHPDHRPVGVGPATPASGWRSAPAPRTSAPPRRWAGRLIASPP